MSNSPLFVLEIIDPLLDVKDCTKWAAECISLNVFLWIPMRNSRLDNYLLYIGQRTAHVLKYTQLPAVHRPVGCPCTVYTVVLMDKNMNVLPNIDIQNTYLMLMKIEKKVLQRKFLNLNIISIRTNLH